MDMYIASLFGVFDFIERFLFGNDAALCLFGSSCRTTLVSDVFVSNIVVVAGFLVIFVLGFFLAVIGSLGAVGLGRLGLGLALLVLRFCEVSVWGEALHLAIIVDVRRTGSGFVVFAVLFIVFVDFLIFVDALVFTILGARASALVFSGSRSISIVWKDAMQAMRSACAGIHTNSL